MQTKINIIGNYKVLPDEIIKACHDDRLIATIFYNRGYKDIGTIREMLWEDYYEPIHPSLFPDMEMAVSLIATAIRNKDKIAIYGDYDVDGVTATTVLMQSIGSFTDNIIYHVPDRFKEGYGMSEDVIRQLYAKQVTLIITCDCGISNVNEITLCKSLGMTVILTDHHNMPDTLPVADAILNPKQLPVGHKARNLSGCAMAYFLCWALFAHFDRESESEHLLDLVALSLVADVVPLHGENRYLLKRGMNQLFQTNRPGLLALFQIIEKTAKIQTEEDIAFAIAPRINAAGRMDSARLPVDLLLSNDPIVSSALAQRIDELNTQRKKVQQEIVEEAKEMVEKGLKNKPILVLYSPHWHHGIIGIAAGKISETYQKPAILLSLKEDGLTIVGSARSVEEVNIYELIKASSAHLLKFGGHSQAAGLSLTKGNLNAFVWCIENIAQESILMDAQHKVDVDLELSLEEINEVLYDSISKAGPYGEGFEAPLFFTRGVHVIVDRKTQKNHHIMVLSDDDGNNIPAVQWFGEEASLEGKSYDIVYTTGRNTYKGNDQIQLTLGHLIARSTKSIVTRHIHIVDQRGKMKGEDKSSGSYMESENQETSVILESMKNQEEKELYFYEGLNKLSKIDRFSDETQFSASSQDFVNRFSITECDVLVLVSIPMNLSFFKQIVFLSGAKKVVLRFDEKQDYSFAVFMKNFMSLIKSAVQKSGGKTSLGLLSSRMNVEETTIEIALEYLVKRGLLQIENTSDDEIILEMIQGLASKKLFAIEKQLKEALREKEFYQETMYKMDAGAFVGFFDGLSI